MELPAFRVRREVTVPPGGGATGFGLKDAVSPLGSPEMVRLVGSSYSPTDETVMVTVADVPWVMFRTAGVAAMVKSGGTFTVREMVAEWVSVPAVPVTVMVKVPRAAFEFAVRVRVAVACPLAGGVAGLGVKASATPEGRPVAVRLTGELKSL